MKDKVIEAMVAEDEITAAIFCHHQFKGDDFVARELARKILALPSMRKQKTRQSS
jgi:hypothetical protein